jgi:hypothetical protein
MTKSFLYMCSLVGLTTLILYSSGCQKAYYKTMEVFGKEKRDILVSRVEKARDAQQEAKQEFQSALEQFSSVVKIRSSELQDKYNQLKAELDKSEAGAKNVSKRIADVERVTKDLMKEWNKELDQYSNKDLRLISEKKYKQTQERCDQLIAAMKQAEQKMEPVLSAFRDQVLFLKHNLNAQAVASLQGELVTIESNVAKLIKDMDKSIAEANSFISTMTAEK